MSSDERTIGPAGAGKAKGNTMSTKRLSLSSIGGSRQSKRRHRAGIGRVALVAFVMLMLVLPLTSGRASAADDELVILDDAIEMAPVDDAVDEAVLEEDETPAAELDQIDDPVLTDPVLDPGDPAGPSDLYVNPILCPADLDLWSVDYYGLAAGCQGGWANGYTVAVSDVYLNSFSAQVVADGPTYTAGLPAQSYLIGITDLGGSQVTMRVICSADDFLGNDVIPFADAPVYGNAELAIQGDLMYWCDAFVLGGDTGGAEDVGEVTIYLNKHICPENVFSDDVYFLASVCHGQLPGVDFSFDNGSGGNWVVTTDANSLATFGPVGTGPWTITETIPGGYGDPQVFCGYDDFLGNDVGSYEHPDMTGGAFSIDIPADVAVAFCDVYNHPTDSEGGSITVFKYNCPDGFDATTQDVYAECGALVDGVQFNTSGPNGYAAQTNTGDSIGGAVYFGGLEAGDYEVVETVPTDYAAHVVSCTSDTKQFVQQHEEDLSDTPSLPWSLDDNEDIVCFWYNVPTHHNDNVDVFITKWGCPAGFSSDDPSELAAECDEEMEGIDFTAEHIVSGTTATDDTGGQPARAAFTPWYTGDSTFTEDIPSGYGDPKVYCYIEDDFGDVVPGYEYAEYTATGGTIEMSIPTPPADDLYTVFCDWYNFPYEEDGHVTIHKWECPEGTPYGEDLEYYLDHCTEAMEGVDFEQGPHSGSKETVTTDASGEVSFPVDENADWSIEEIIPSGYSENPMAFCGWGGDMIDDEDENLVYAIDGFANLGPDGGTMLRFDTYEQFGMDCNWFNFPHDDDSDVTIYKYTCPAGYDLYDAGADPKSDCVELTNGVNFHLLPQSGTELQTMTGDSINGAVYFGGVGNGTFTIWEDLPAGTVGTWVTCQWYEELGPYVYEQLEPYAPADGVGTHISVDLAKGDDLICQWYNVPEQTWDGGELTITKYWCQGYVVNSQTCELGSGVKFLVESAAGGSPILVETGPSGSVSLNLPEGAWTVTEKDYEWCKAVASDVDVDGTILTKPNHETTLTVYNCNADTGEKNPPVKKFPNTGSGAMARAAIPAPASGGLSPELLTMAGGLLQLGLVVAGRTLGLSPAGMIAAVMDR